MTLGLWLCMHESQLSPSVLCIFLHQRFQHLLCHFYIRTCLKYFHLCKNLSHNRLFFKCVFFLLPLRDILKLPQTAKTAFSEMFYLNEFHIMK